MKTTSYDVKFWELRPNLSSPKPGKPRRVVSYTARWTVAGAPKSKTLRTKQQAQNYLAELRQAAKDGEAFDIASGLPLSHLESEPEPVGPSVLEFAQDYVISRWPHTAARTRETDAYALLCVIPALVADLPDRPTDDELREVLRNHVLLPEGRRAELTREQTVTLRWLEKASLPLSALEEDGIARTALAAISVTFAGKAAAPNTIARKREVLNHLLELAVHGEKLTSNPLKNLKGITSRRPKTVVAVDPRMVVNPRQAKALLEAVPKVGRTRGQRLKAMFACMYYAALRPEEAADLRADNLTLPEKGWGLIILERARPQANKRWTTSGETHDARHLKHRAEKETREIPIPPVLVAILRDHIKTYGTAEDGRLFRTSRGKPYSASAYTTVWQETRMLAFTRAQARSPLAGRPYDLRHAAVSLWLNAGVPAAEVAKRAGTSVEVLHRVYEKCLDGQRRTVNGKINRALGA